MGRDEPAAGTETPRYRSCVTVGGRDVRRKAEDRRDKDGERIVHRRRGLGADRDGAKR